MGGRGFALEFDGGRGLGLITYHRVSLCPTESVTLSSNVNSAAAAEGLPWILPVAGLTFRLRPAGNVVGRPSWPSTSQ